jgi:hypothetical protein
MKEVFEKSDIKIAKSPELLNHAYSAHLELNPKENPIHESQPTVKEITAPNNILLELFGH